EGGQALRARVARPGLGRVCGPRQGPEGDPGPRDDAGPGGAARRDRGAHGEVPRPPLGVAAGARGGPALPRLVLARGHRPGGGRHAAHARVPGGGRDVLRHVRHGPDGEPPRLRVHEHLVLAQRRPRVVRAHPRRGRRRPGHRRAPLRVPRRVRHRPDGVGRRCVRRPDRDLRGPGDVRADPRRQGRPAVQAAHQAQVGRPQRRRPRPAEGVRRPDGRRRGDRRPGRADRAGRRPARGTRGRRRL
ncbi:MAG: NADH-ubiquinone oxidoreductase chain E, partial [uncultured Solirubrobacteraceae bacterium]